MEKRIAKKRILLIALCMMMILGVLGLSGCKDNDQPVSNEGQKIEAKLYFGSEEYAATGDESLPKLMEPVTVEIGTTTDTALKDVVELLKKVPEGKEGYITMFAAEFTVNKVTEKDGTAFVDFSSKDLAGGSLEETLLIDQIVSTLTSTFESVKQVQFTVDGASAETLMGQVDVSQPIGPSGVSGTAATEE